MEPLPPPISPRRRGRGKKSISGGVPNFPSASEIYRLTNPEQFDEDEEEYVPEAPKEPDDPTRLTTVEAEEFKGVMYELISRRSESLRIFQAMPEQERFFESDASERIALGGNRGGKTTVSVVEIARALTGQDPFDKYPKEGGKCILVGKDLTHCSKVFYSKLFKAGAFKVIRDEVTGQWRSYNPNDPEDKARALEAKKAPALIPSRFYDYNKIAWENKKDEIPKTIPLKNGWVIHFFSSLGAPPQGWNVDLVCLAGWSKIFDPVAGEYRRIDQIENPFHVMSLNVETGSMEVCESSRPFVKGYGEIVRVRLSNGAEIFTTRQHRVLSLDRRWISIEQAYEFGVGLADPTSSLNLFGETLSVRTQGMFQTPQQSELKSIIETSPEDHHPSDCGIPERSNLDYCVSGNAHVSSRLLSSLASCSTLLRRCGERLRIAIEGVQEFLPSQPDALLRNLAYQQGVNPERKLGCIHTDPVVSCVVSSQNVHHEAHSCEFLHLSHEQLSLQNSGMPLGLTQFLRSSLVDLHTSVELKAGQAPASFSGLALGGSVRLLRAIASRCSRMIDSVRLAIQCSSYRPCKVSEAVLFPANPESRIASLDLTSEGVISSLPLHVTSLDTVYQAPIWDIHVAKHHNYLYGGTVSHNCFDEEVEHPLWYPEMSARLLDNRVEDPETGKVRSGKFIWSATPQAGTQQLYDLKVRADTYVGEPNPPIEVFEFGMLDNPWVSDTAKQEFIAKFADNEDEINVRVYGKFALLGTRVYPEFMPKGVHGMATIPIPEDWTSYAVIDPGRQTCAILFVAIAPPNSEWGKRKIIYDMLYIKKCNAKIFAEKFVERVNGRPIQYGIIDHRAGRITEIGSGVTHEQQYSNALKEKGFKFEQGGTSFVWSSDDVKAGIESVRSAMHIIDGQSELVVMHEKCKELLWEIERYSYRRLPNGLVTDEPIKLNDHAADALRYACVAKLRYIKPRRRKAAIGYTNEYLAKKKAREKHRAVSDGKYDGSHMVG